MLNTPFWIFTATFFLLLIWILIAFTIKEIRCIRCKKHKTIRGAILYKASEESSFFDEYVCKDCQ